MHTIAVVNEKGGTGKTTTAVNLAAALGEMQHKVLLVDLDGQAASSRWLGVEEDTSFADALYTGKGLNPIPDVIPNVSLAPASGKLDAVAHDLRPTQGGQLRRLLSEVSDRFEFVIIDCPPSLGNRLIGNALIASSHAIVPVETSVLALDGLKILLTTLEDVREGFGHNIILAGVLACRFDSRTRLSRLILAELQRALPGRVFQTVIRENVRMRECPASGQSIITYAPDSHAAEDYRSLARELLASPWLSAVPQDQADASGTVAFMAAEKDQHLGESLRQTVRRTQPAGDDDASAWKKRLEEAQQRLTGEGAAPDSSESQESGQAADVVEQPVVEPVAQVPVEPAAADVAAISQEAPAPQPEQESQAAFEMPPIAEVPQASQAAGQDEPAVAIEAQPATTEPQFAVAESLPSEVPPAGLQTTEMPAAVEPAIWIDPSAAPAAGPAAEAHTPEQAAESNLPAGHSSGWLGTKFAPEKSGSTATSATKTGWEHAVTGAESHNGHNGHNEQDGHNGHSESGVLPPVESVWDKPASNAPVSGDASWLELITGSAQASSPAQAPMTGSSPEATPAEGQAPQAVPPPLPPGEPEEFSWGPNAAGAEPAAPEASPDCPHLRKYLAKLQGEGTQDGAAKESQDTEESKPKGLLGRIFARSR